DRAEGEHLKARELDVRYGDAGLDRRVDDDVERFRAPVHLDETRSFALAEAKRQNARGVLPLGAERAPSVLLRRLLERSPPRIERDEERHPRERGEAPKGEHDLLQSRGFGIETRSAPDARLGATSEQLYAPGKSHPRRQPPSTIRESAAIVEE